MNSSLTLPRMAACTAGLLLVTALMSGCAELTLVNSVGTLANGPAPDYSREAETNIQAFSYPVSKVYGALVTVVERDGRKIVTSDSDTHILRVAYPFSWRHNNWGGVITISYTLNELVPGEPETIVHVVGGARDPLFRIRKLGEAILRDLGDELVRQAASG